MSRYIPIILLIAALLSAGCAQSLYTQGKRASDGGDYDTALSILYEAVGEAPDDFMAWREIGIAYYNQGVLSKAEEAFASSNRIRPNALSNFYLGLIFEQTGEIDKAIRVYGAAINLYGDGETKDMIEGRLGVLIDKKLINEARMAVRDEDSLSVVATPRNTIAVINFDGSNLPREIEPLALGLAEFTAMDLAKVGDLKVLERLKINVILDELELGESGFADPVNAPRIGKLLGSRNVVVGSVTSTGKEGFRIDSRIVDTEESSLSGTKPMQGELGRFFDVQKEFVFSLLDTLGVQISKKERDAIEEVPTESFLAFMSYSKGLFYERRGMYGDAARSFREASTQDPGFSAASGMAAKMTSTSDYNDKGKPGRGGSDFERKVTSSMQKGSEEGGLGSVQAANLANNQFIMNTDLYWLYGSYAIEPPGGGPVGKGFGTIMIWGNLDAD
ncbi:MAG: tetratricopeptide repeat protein [Candidatus Krumholzibacteriota bacterium]|nr:tetratricopeptide repeat protein [Candidatus Krumholzibacteriota bacterium]